MNNRAFIDLGIKSIDEETRQIEGWATRPEVDRMGDIVMPKGARFKLPLPFLLDHDHRKAVGEVDRVEVTDSGIKFWAQIRKIAEPGEVKDLCDQAWTLIKHGLRKSVSIGFNPEEAEPLPKGGWRFLSWEWLELSAVTVPALASADLGVSKSFSAGQSYTTVAPSPEISQNDMPAAIGKGRVVKLSDPARDRAPPLFVIREIKRTA